MIYIDSKRCKEETLRKRYGEDAIICDVTSQSRNKQLVRLSPFFPHGNIPIPFSPEYAAMSVEGIWQGLKVFESCGIDMSSFQNDTMTGLKRTVRKFGKPLGHQKGVESTELLGYYDARMLIYLPSYKWVLENVSDVADIIEHIKQRSKTNNIVLLDYNTNIDVKNTSSPISHAALLRMFIEDCYPNYEGTKMIHFK